jgi:hypothetical protein
MQGLCRMFGPLLPFHIVEISAEDSCNKLLFIEIGIYATKLIRK